MDPVTILGAVGSVVGITAFGLKIAQFLDDFIGEYTEAAENFIAVLEGVQSTSDALDQVREFLEAEEKTVRDGKAPQLFSSKALKQVKTTSDKCLKVFWRIEAVILKKTPTDEEIKARLEKFHLGVKENKQPDFLQLDRGLKFKRIDRWKWSFNVKDKLEKYNRQLDRQQYTLILMFQVISLNINLTKPNLNAPHKIHYLYEQIPHTALQSGLPEVRRRRQSSYMYAQGSAKPNSRYWYDEPPDYYYPPPPRVPRRGNSRYRPSSNLPDAPPEKPRRRSLSSSPDRGRQNPRPSQPSRRRRHSLSGDEMEEARKLDDEEKKQYSGDEGSVAERLRKKIIALEAIIASDRKIAGRKDSNIADIKTTETAPEAKVGEPLIRPRFTQSPSRMNEDELESVLDSIRPQRGSYRGSVVPEQKDGRPKRPVRYQKPSVTDQPVDTPSEESTPGNLNSPPMVFDFDLTETVAPQGEGSLPASKLGDNHDEKVGNEVNSKKMPSDQKPVDNHEPLESSKNAPASLVPKEEDPVSGSSRTNYGSAWSFGDLDEPKEPIKMGWKNSESLVEIPQPLAKIFPMETSPSLLNQTPSSPGATQPTTYSGTTNVSTNTEQVDLSAMKTTDDLSDAQFFTESDYAYGWGSTRNRKKEESTVVLDEPAKLDFDFNTTSFLDESSIKIKATTSTAHAWPTLESWSKGSNGKSKAVGEAEGLNSEDKAFIFGFGGKGKGKEDIQETKIKPAQQIKELNTSDDDFYSSDDQKGEEVYHDKPVSAETGRFDPEAWNSKFAQNDVHYDSSDGSSSHTSSIRASNNTTLNGSTLKDENNALPKDASSRYTGVSSNPGISSQRKNTVIDDLLQNGILPQPEPVADSVINDWVFAIISKESKKKVTDKQPVTTEPRRRKPNVWLQDTTSPESMALILHPDRARIKRTWVEEPHRPPAYLRDEDVHSVNLSVPDETEGTHVEDVSNLVVEDEGSSPATRQFPPGMSSTQNGEKFTTASGGRKITLVTSNGNVKSDAATTANLHSLETVSDKMSGALLPKEANNPLSTDAEKEKPLPLIFSNLEKLTNPRKYSKRKNTPGLKRKEKFDDQIEDTSRKVATVDDMDVSTAIAKITSQKDIPSSNDKGKAKLRDEDILEESGIIVEDFPGSKRQEYSKKTTAKPSQKTDRIIKEVPPAPSQPPTGRIVGDGSSTESITTFRKPWYKRAITKPSKYRTVDPTESQGPGSSIYSDIDRAPTRLELIRNLVRLPRKRHEVYRGFISAFVIRDGEYHQIPHNGRFDVNKPSRMQKDKGTDWWKEYAFLTPKDLVALKAILEETKEYEKTLLHLKYLQKAKFQFWASTDQVLIAVVSNEAHSWSRSESESEEEISVDRRRAFQGTKKERQTLSSSKDITSDSKASDAKVKSDKSPDYESRRLYLAYTIRVLFPHNMYGDVEGVKPTCQREPFSESDILQRITNLNETGPGIIQKKIGLMASQDEEIEKLLKKLVSTNENPDCAWTLAQLDDHDGPGQGRRSITVYLKRISRVSKIQIEEEPMAVQIPSSHSQKPIPSRPAPPKEHPASILRPTVTFEDQTEKSKAAGSTPLGEGQLSEPGRKPGTIRVERTRQESFDDDYATGLERERSGPESSRRPTVESRNPFSPPPSFTPSGPDTGYFRTAADTRDAFRPSSSIPLGPNVRSSRNLSPEPTVTIERLFEIPESSRRPAMSVPPSGVNVRRSVRNPYSQSNPQPSYRSSRYEPYDRAPQYDGYYDSSYYYDDVPNAPEAPYINRDSLRSQNADIRSRPAVPLVPANNQFVRTGSAYSEGRGPWPPVLPARDLQIGNRSLPGRPVLGPGTDLYSRETEPYIDPREMSSRERPVIVDERSIHPYGTLSHPYESYPEREVIDPLIYHQRPAMQYPEHYDSRSYDPFDLNIAAEEESGNNLVQKLLKDWTPAGEGKADDAKGKGKEKEGDKANPKDADGKVGGEKEGDGGEDDDEEDTSDYTDEDWDEMHDYGGVRLTDTHPMSGAGRELMRRPSYSSRSYYAPPSTYGPPSYGPSSFAPASYAPNEPYFHYPPPPPPPLPMTINNRGRGRQIVTEAPPLIPKARSPAPAVIPRPRARDRAKTTINIDTRGTDEHEKFGRPEPSFDSRIRDVDEDGIGLTRERDISRSPPPVRYRERVVQRERSLSPPPTRVREDFEGGTRARETAQHDRFARAEINDYLKTADSTTRTEHSRSSRHNEGEALTAQSQRERLAMQRKEELAELDSREKRLDGATTAERKIYDEIFAEISDPVVMQEVEGEYKDRMEELENQRKELHRHKEKMKEAERDSERLQREKDSSATDFMPGVEGERRERTVSPAGNISDELDETWDTISSDEIEPSDSASRPPVSTRRSQPRYVPPPTTRNTRPTPAASTENSRTPGRPRSRRHRYPIPAPPSSVDYLEDPYPGYGRGYPTPSTRYGGAPVRPGYATSAYSVPGGGGPYAPPSYSSAPVRPGYATSAYSVPGGGGPYAPPSYSSAPGARSQYGLPPRGQYYHPGVEAPPGAGYSGGPRRPVSAHGRSGGYGGHEYMPYDQQPYGGSPWD